MRNQKKKYVAIGAIILIALAIVVAFGLNNSGKSIGGKPLAFGENQNIKVYYPLFASVCCESSINSWVPAVLTPKTNSQSYACPLASGGCRINGVPTVKCPGISWTHPLGWTSMWNMKLYNKGSQYPAYEFYKVPILSDKLPSTTAVPFSGRIEYQGSCLDNNIYLGGITTIIALFSKGADPTSAQLNIEYLNTYLTVHPSMGGPYGIPGSDLCQKQTIDINSINNPMKKEPISTDEAKANSANDIANKEFGGDAGNTDSQGIYLTRAPDQLYPGTSASCYRTVDKWVTLDDFGNVNPKGQYQGNDVICEYGSGLFKLETIKTVGDTIYLVPTQRLTSPDKFCCSDQDCKYLGLEYNCAKSEYTCKKVVGYCKSDVDCMPMGGVLKDQNCFQDSTSATFYTWNSVCNTLTNMCAPYPGTKTSVKCCPSFCSAYGKICDFQKGCVDIIPPKENCPPGQCCDKDNGFGYFAQDCAEGKSCCSKSQGVGTCKATCEPGSEEKCSGCWAWLKDKMGVKQECSTRIWSKIWDSLSCPFYFLKLGILAIVSLLALFLGQQFFSKFRLQPVFSWILGLFFAGLVAFIGYMFLEWHIIISALVIMIVGILIIGAIPGAPAFIGKSVGNLGKGYGEYRRSRR